MPSLKGLNSGQKPISEGVPPVVSPTPINSTTIAVSKTQEMENKNLLVDEQFEFGDIEQRRSSAAECFSRQNQEYLAAEQRRLSEVHYRAPAAKQNTLEEEAKRNMEAYLAEKKKKEVHAVLQLRLQEAEIQAREDTEFQESERKRQLEAEARTREIRQMLHDEQRRVETHMGIGGSIDAAEPKEKPSTCCVVT